MIDTIKDINRYWIDITAGNLLIRQWTLQEYQTTDPHKHIFEKYWSPCCPICRFTPYPYDNKKEAKLAAEKHSCRSGHKCTVKYLEHELACFEIRHEFLENLGVWITKQEQY